MSATIPNCISYDPTYAFEMAVIIREGLARMMERQEDVFYYITALNENYEHPAMPEGAEDGIIRGMYLLKSTEAGETSGNRSGHRVHLLGSGAILREVIAAAELLATDFGVSADIWSVPSFTELARDAQETDRWNLLNPLEQTRVAYVSRLLAERGSGPVIASTDYMKAYAEQIRPAVPYSYRVLGTDGFGRSDYRRKLRFHFEVDRHFIAVSALKALADENKIPSTTVAEALARYRIDPKKPNPVKS